MFKHPTIPRLPPVYSSASHQPRQLVVRLFLRRVATALSYSILAFVAYLVSLELLAMYTEGDQLHYHSFWHALANARASEVPFLQAFYTGSAEPLYGYTVWVASNAGWDKNTFISVCNAVLTVLLVLYLRRNHVPRTVVLLFLVNFYFLVLLTAAERLKFSMVLLLAFGLTTSRWRYIWAATALTAHFQTFIFYAALLGGKVLAALRAKNTAHSIAGLVVVGTFLGLVAYYFSAEISEKTARYVDLEGPQTFVASAALLMAGLVTLRYRWRFLFHLAPVIAATVLLGGARVNMIGFMLFTWLAVIEKRTTHPAFLAVLCYFAYKSIGFLQTILEEGTAFVVPY